MGYRRYYRRQSDPVQDLITVIVAIILFICVLWYFYSIMSQPGAFNILPRTPTPTPPAFTNVIMLDPISSVVFICGVGAILIGASGLALLGIFVLFQRTRSRSTSSVVNRTNLQQGAPANLTVTQPATTKPSTSDVYQSSQEATLNTYLSPTAIPSVQSRTLSTLTAEEEAKLEARSILTRFERAFFWTLKKAVEDDFYIFPQIPLKHLVPSERLGRIPSRLNWTLQRGVVDFLLVDPSSLGAVIVFEFDDPSHKQANVRASDQRKNELCQKIGLPILRFSSEEKWVAQQIREQVLASVPSQKLTFLSSWEVKVFSALREAQPQWFVFPKVALNFVIRPVGWISKEDFKTLENETADFVLAHPTQLGTLLVAELRTPKHNLIKEGLLEKAKIPFLCFENSELPDTKELRQRIQLAIQSVGNRND